MIYLILLICILILILYLYFKKENFKQLRDVDELMNFKSSDTCETIYDYSDIKNRLYIKNLK